MTREEAIKVLKKKMYEEADEITIEHLDGSQCMRTINIDLEMKEAIEVLEQPMTLAEFLGWEEDVEYKKGENIVWMISGGQLYIKSIRENDWYKASYEWNESDIERLRAYKKAEKKETKEELLGELQKYVSSERINEIIEKLREVE